MEQEGFARGDPAGLVKREGASWKETVQVEMAFQLLVPGVEDTGKAWGSVEVTVGEF